MDAAYWLALACFCQAEQGMEVQADTNYRATSNSIIYIFVTIVLKHQLNVMIWVLLDQNVTYI